MARGIKTRSLWANPEYRKRMSEAHRKPITKNKPCSECGLIFYKPVKFSKKQWALTKFCGFPCFGIYNGRQKKGVSLPWKAGRKHTPEALEKNRLAHLKVNPIYKREGYYTHKAMERYARLKGAEGKFTLEEWSQLKCEHDYRCVHCGKSEQEVKLTKDHIIPLTKGGSNYIDNIQPLCQSCNSRKGNRLYI